MQKRERKQFIFNWGYFVQLSLLVLGGNDGAYRVLDLMIA